jgi:hypothetical protein
VALGIRDNSWDALAGRNVVGFALGGLLSRALAKMMEDPHIGVRDPAVAVRVLALDGAAALVIFGTVIGLSQWFMLRTALRDALWLKSRVKACLKAGAATSTCSYVKRRRTGWSLRLVRHRGGARGRSRWTVDV